MATINDVAKRAGVSTTTVSHVINKTRYVSNELHTRVSEAIKELHYRPNGIARGLRTKKTRTLGMLIPDGANPFYAEVARGIEDTCFDLGYNVIICNSDLNVQKEVEYLKLLIQKGIDGLYLVAVGNNPKTVEILSNTDIPKVLVDQELKGFQADYVFVDNYRGGYEATDHLLKLGHTRIACIAGPLNLSTGSNRLRGYRDALKNANLDVDERLIKFGNFQSSSGYDQFQSLLKQKTPFTGIFVCNDLMAIGALYGAFEMGINIPDQLSIIGYDNIPMASMTIPPLTTISQPQYEMGKAAAKFVISRINKKNMRSRRKIIKSQLIVRGSCAPFSK